MKRIFSFFSLFLSLSLSTGSFAMSIGRDGESYIETGISWQPVRYENWDAEIQASFPGSPKSGISSGFYFIHSQYEGTDYEIHTAMNGYYLLPSTEEDFLEQVRDIVQENEILLKVHSKGLPVIYAAEIQTYDSDTNELTRVLRIYATSEKLFFAVVEGPDLSLVNQFFEKIQFIR